MDGLRVEGLRVTFGATSAVDTVDLTVGPGETVALLGPSGCGKSTLLRAVAGLEHPKAGTVSWDGTDVTGWSPDRRGFGLMFQDHALFPHRTVGENVAFGPRMAGAPKAEQRSRAADALTRVGLDGYAERTVDTLSGGEAQRVALARALAPRPRLLMLDEPLGSLDRVLRDELAEELRAVLDDSGVPAIHVTHDQEEAYAVADRIVVMREGRIVQDGPAAEVWARPASRFVARFLGHGNVVEPPALRLLGLDPPPGAAAVVVREAALALTAVDHPDARPARVIDVRFRGATSRVVVEVGPAEPSRDVVSLAVHTARPPAVGETVGLTIDRAEVHPLPH